MATLKDIFESINEYSLSDLVSKYEISEFIETGTGLGDTIDYCLDKGFSKITSIEIHEEIAEKARDRFKETGENLNITNIINGDSVSVLQEITPSLDTNTLFWLDAHFPGVDFKYAEFGDEKDVDKRIPLQKELEIIVANKDVTNDIFLIDDLRIYEDGNYEAGNWDLRDTYGANSLDFVYNQIGKTHTIHKFYKHQGFLICLPKKEKRFRIAIPFRGRLEYLKLTLATLKEAMRGQDIPITLYNTCPTKEGNNLDIIAEMEHVEIKNITCSSIDTIIPKVITDAFNISEDDYVILLDSDSIVHPKAIEKFKEMADECPDLGLGTLFNTATHPFIEKGDKYGTKRTIGGFGCLINRYAWNQYGKRIKTHWDVEMSNNISDSNEFHVYCTIHSYLEHMGFSGTHRHGTLEELGEPHSIDRASNFFN